MKKKAIIEKTKNKLWQFGYRVKDYSMVDPVSFDLLIDNKIRVKVGEEIPNEYPRNCDVFVTEHKTGAIVFVMKKFKNVTSPYEAFGRPKFSNTNNHANNTKGQNDKRITQKKGD